MSADKIITSAQLAANNGKDCKPLWIKIGTEVFDLSKFQDMHPGGVSVLKKVAGKDATDAFRMYHAPAVMAKYREKLRIGVLQEAVKEEEELEQRRLMARSAILDMDLAYGDQIPYGDPAWYQRSTVNPFYKQTHRDFRARVRAFVENEIIATMSSWRHLGVPPKELVAKMGKEGLLACMAGGTPFPREHVDPGTPEPEDFDFFHIQILFDEVSRCGDAGVIAALTNGPSIAVCALLKFGSEEVKKSGIVREVLMGRKMIALAVTEPVGGSDVSSLSCELTVNKDGSMTVTGNKKFITNGTYADYFTLLAKDPERGLTMVLVEANLDGFSTKKVKIPNNTVSGTAFLDFNNTPVRFIVGKRGEGFKLQMAAFNFERWYVSVCMVRLARVCLEESIRYSVKRKTFGKELNQHQAVRMRIAEMVRDVESCQAWLDSITYQLNVLEVRRAANVLGDTIGSLKVQASYVYDRCARHCTHIFGGNSLQADGPGGKIEPALGQTKAYLIPAGAADILDDFTARRIFFGAKNLAKL